VGTPIGDERRVELLAEVLPALRGALSVDGPRVLQVDLSPPVLEFVGGRDARELSQVGAACPDHLVHTKRRPAWIEFDAGHDDAAVLRERLIEQVHAFQAARAGVLRALPRRGRHAARSQPRAVLIEGVGLVSVGRTLKAARLSRDLYQRAIAVMRGASALGGFVSLSDEESFAIEHWPLELYKLSLAPPPRRVRRSRGV